MTEHEPPFERGSGAMSRGLRTLLRFWWLTVPFGLIGAGTGAWLATLVPTTYTAEVRLVVGGQSLDAQTVPGFVFASQELAATYARYVDEASATGQLEQRVGIDTAESITSITASPIPESSVIVIEVQGVVAEDVREAAQALAEALVQQVTAAAAGEDLAAALAEFEQLSTEVAQKEVDLQLLREQLGAVSTVPDPTPLQVAQATDLRAAIATSAAELSVLQLRQDAAGVRYSELSGENNAALSVIRPAEVVADDATTRLIVWAVLGGALGVGLVFLVLFRLPRRSRPPMDGYEDLEAPPSPSPDRHASDPLLFPESVNVGQRLSAGSSQRAQDGDTGLDVPGRTSPAEARAPRRSP